MLWTDSLFVTQDDLVRIDGQIVSVAETEGVALTGDNGSIRLGLEEAANEIQKLIIAFGGYLNSGDLTANHLAAVLNVGIGNSVRMKAGLNQICVSGDSASSWNWIKQFAIYWCLRIFYRNVFARTVNDRYEKKMNMYKDEIIRRIQPTLFGLGVPVVLQPLYAPAAYFMRNTGSWDSTNVSLVAGAGTLDDSHYCDVVVTFVDMSQTNRYVSAAKPNNAESDGSARVTQQMGVGNVIHVDITSLNPPTGTQDPSQVLVVVISPLVATHWNVYASSVAGGTLYLQNATPIPIATKTYTFAGDPAFSGYTIGLGQYADRRLSLLPMRQRA